MLLDHIRDAFSLHDSVDKLGKLARESGDFKPSMAAGSEEMAQMQVLLQRVQEGCTELQVLSQQNCLISTWLNAVKPLVREAAGLEQAVGQHVVSATQSDADPLLNDLKLLSKGMKDGKDWLEGLSLGHQNQWKPLYSHAESTIMKDAKVAGLRAPIAKTEEATLFCYLCVSWLAK